MVACGYVVTHEYIIMVAHGYVVGLGAVVTRFCFSLMVVWC